MSYLRNIPLSAGLLLAAAITIAPAQKNATVFTDDGSGADLSLSPPENGFNILGASFRYLPAIDELLIRIRFDGVAGDVDGDGDPDSGTGDIANFGVGETLGMSVDLDCDGTPDFVIGIPTAEVPAPLQAASILRVRNAIAPFATGDSFGTTDLPGIQAATFPTSSSSPDAVFQVTNWSQTGRNSEQFIATFFANSTSDSRDADLMPCAVNLNFPGRGHVREGDFLNDVGIPPQSPNSTTGWDLTTTNFGYDPSADTMRITQKFNGIAGDADGDGDPGNWSLPINGDDFPNLGGSESIAIAFDFDENGTFDTVVGIPSDSAIDPADLSVPIADFDGSINNLGTSFGDPTTTSATASLAHNPSASEPDFIITIENWSELTPTPFQFGYRAFAGSVNDAGFGEDNQVNNVALDAIFETRSDGFTDFADVGVPPGHPTFSGWDFKSLDFVHDPAQDKLTIDIDYFAIAGDADGDGDPGVMTAFSGGTDSPNLGAGETITVVFDLDDDGTEDVVVGIPTSRALDPNTLLLDIAAIAPGQPTGQNYGTPDASGATAYAAANPSAANPDFKIIIHGWSLLDPEGPEDFSFRVFSGSSIDAGFGEDNIPNPGAPAEDATLKREVLVGAPSFGNITAGGDGQIRLTLLGQEETDYTINDLSSNADPSTAQPVGTVTEMLEDITLATGQGTTDFLGQAEFIFLPSTPSATRQFYQIIETGSGS